jgi:hypothetical protein
MIILKFDHSKSPRQSTQKSPPRDKILVDAKVSASLRRKHRKISLPRISNEPHDEAHTA